MSGPVVCHLSTGHRPDDTRVARKECATLGAAGYDVRFVVPTVDVPDLGPGVRIVPVPPPADRRERLLRTGRLVLRAALRQDAALYQVHDIDLLPAALALKARGKKVVYDVHEVFPRQLRQMVSLPRPVRWPASVAVGGLERVVARLADGVVAATSTIAKRFPAHKTWLVQNFPLDDELSFAPGEPYRRRPRQVVYAGSLSPSRGALEMVRAMAGFGPAEVQLVLCAQVKPASLRAEMAAQPGWDRVRETGWLSRADLAAEYGRSRAGLAVLHPTPQYVDALPVKLFEYMAAGLPVVVSDVPLWRGIVEDARCGLLVDPLDPQAIAAAIRWLLDHPDEAAEMGRRGRTAVRRSYSWATEASTLLRMYHALVGPPGARAATRGRPSGNG